MLVLSKRNIMLRANGDTDVVSLKRDEITAVPDWVAKLPYFSALVKDGKILVTEQKKPTVSKEAPASQKKKK